MSVTRSDVNAFTFEPPGLSRCHQRLGLHATPGLTFSLTTAFNSTVPRSFQTLSESPSAMSRPAASSGLTHILGSFSAFIREGRFENVEFRKWWAAGVRRLMG